MDKRFLLPAALSLIGLIFAILESAGLSITALFAAIFGTCLHGMRQKEKRPTQESTGEPEDSD